MIELSKRRGLVVSMADGKLKSLYAGVPLGIAFRILLMPVVLTIADFSVTLFFQPEAYWEGERSTVIESNPVARLVLLIHPLLMIPAMMAWYLVMFPLVFRTPAWIGLRLVVLHILGHLVAISGWLIRMAEQGGLITVVLASLCLPVSWWVLRPFLGQWSSVRPIRSLYS